MKRINPAELAEFFRKGPTKPIRDYFVQLYHEEVEGCCGLTATLIARGAATPELFEYLGHASTSDGACQIAKVLGLDENYAIGFAKGWDYLDDADRPEWAVGYKDGQLASDACGLPDPGEDDDDNDP